MKPTTEQVRQWAREAGLWHYLPQGKEFGAESAESCLRHFFAAAYAAGAAAMKERAAMIAEGWECEAAGGVYLTCGNGNFWDEGTIYDQGSADAAGAIRALKGEKE